MAEQPFADRQEAGRALVARLMSMHLTHPIVLALPRGGVPVGAEVAAGLGAELDVFVARKIGVPFQPELGVGAIAEGGEPVLDEPLISAVGLSRDDLRAAIAAEHLELSRRVRTYRGGRVLPDLTHRDVVLVDDGLATGGTARAALRALRTGGVRRTVLAVPVAPPETVDALSPEADEVVAVLTPPRFGAVGRWYRRFPQLDDAAVVALLAAARGVLPPS